MREKMHTQAMSEMCENENQNNHQGPHHNHQLAHSSAPEPSSPQMNEISTSSPAHSSSPRESQQRAAGEQERHEDARAAHNNNNNHNNGQNKTKRDALARVEVRLLVRRREAGALIGKRGANIKRLRETHSESTFNIPDTGNGPERVVCISAESLATLEAILADIAQLFLEKSVQQVKFQQSNQHHHHHPSRNDEQIELKQLINSSHAGLLIGMGGQSIRKLRNDSKAAIKIYEMCCPQSNERVCAIKARPPVVVSTIKMIQEIISASPDSLKASIVHKPYDALNFDLNLVEKYGGYLPDDLGPLELMQLTTSAGGLVPPSLLASPHHPCRQHHHHLHHHQSLADHFMSPNERRIGHTPANRVIGPALTRQPNLRPQSISVSQARHSNFLADNYASLLNHHLGRFSPQLSPSLLRDSRHHSRFHPYLGGSSPQADAIASKHLQEHEQQRQLIEHLQALSAHQASLALGANQCHHNNNHAGRLTLPESCSCHHHHLGNTAGSPCSYSLSTCTTSAAHSEPAKRVPDCRQTSPPDSANERSALFEAPKDCLSHNQGDDNEKDDCQPPA